MDIYISRQQIIFFGKVKDLTKEIRSLAMQYRTVAELITARLN